LIQKERDQKYQIKKINLKRIRKKRELLSKLKGGA
jgi:hypothetical protein